MIVSRYWCHQYFILLRAVDATIGKQGGFLDPIHKGRASISRGKGIDPAHDLLKPSWGAQNLVCNHGIGADMHVL